MSIEVKSLHDLDADELKSAREIPLSGVFYSDFLLNTWKREYQWEDVVLVSDATMLFGFIKRTSLGNIFYSLPFGWYGGILGEVSSERGTNSIFDWLEKKSFLQENIIQLPQLDATDHLYPERYDRRELSTHVLALEAAPNFSENTRRNIKHSADSDFTISQCNRKSLPHFLSLLRQQVTRTQERRRLPEHFYSELFLQGCKKIGGVISVGAESNGDLKAVHIYFRTGTDIFYFDGVASDKGRERGANFSIFDRMISQCREEGLLRFNFGATPPGDAGLERFKSGWGAEKHRYFEYSRRSLLKQGIDFMVRR